MKEDRRRFPVVWNDDSLTTSMPPQQCLFSIAIYEYSRAI